MPTYNDPSIQYSQAGVEYNSVTTSVTATGSAIGAGTSTVTNRVIRYATAISSGSGTQTADILRRVPRTASATAIGTATSVDRKTARRPATATGTGSSFVTWVATPRPLPPPAPTNQAKVRGRRQTTMVVAQVPVARVTRTQQPQLVAPVLLFNYLEDDETLMCLA